jgi:hypothetical protein
MRRLVLAAVCAAVAGTILVVGVARAADAPGVTGTWKYTVTVNGQERETTLKLKQDGDKVTGTITGRDGKDHPIEDGTYKDGEVSFKVTRERDGQKFTMKYSGKVEGDTFKGKREFERNGETQSRDFEAKRAND